MLISWARGMSPVPPVPLCPCAAPATPLLLKLSVSGTDCRMNIVIYSCAYVRVWRRSRILVCVSEEENQTMTTCSNAVPTLHSWMHTHHIRIYHIHTCVWMCVRALWLLTRERVFWLMMIHEINFNSYDQRLFAFEMKAFSHRFTFDPLAMEDGGWRREETLLGSSLINTCFWLHWFVNKIGVGIRSRIGIGIEVCFFGTKQSCIMSLALHHPPGRHSKLLNKSRTEWLCCAYISLRNELILIREFRFIYSHYSYAQLLVVMIIMLSSRTPTRTGRVISATTTTTKPAKAQANVRWTRCNRLDCLLRTCRYPLFWDSHRAAIKHSRDVDSHHYVTDKRLYLDYSVQVR